GALIIVVYLFIYYFTTTDPYLSAKNFDISAIPIVCIYIVNGALFIGLFQLFKKKVFSQNSIFKKLTAIIAVLGIAVVLFGTATAPNGILYFLINIGFFIAGFIFIKKR